MRVIEKGIPKQDRPITATCRHCESKIEFRPSEVERVHDQRDGDFYRFDCPVCKESVIRHA